MLTLNSLFDSPSLDQCVDPDIQTLAIVPSLVYACNTSHASRSHLPAEMLREASRSYRVLCRDPACLLQAALLTMLHSSDGGRSKRFAASWRSLRACNISFFTNVSCGKGQRSTTEHVRTSSNGTESSQWTRTWLRCSENESIIVDPMSRSYT